MFHPGLLVLLIGTCLAEDKWIWSKNRGINDRRDRIIVDQSQYDNFVTYENNREREYQRQRDREYERQRDRDYERQREREREQTTRRPPFYTRPEQNNDDYDDYDGTSQEDQNKFNGPKYPIFGYGGLQNLIPNPQNGILVGPGGPTGIIGKPAGYRQEYGNAGIGDGTLNHLRPNPANGILVGPGGPTGIIGRPPLNGQFPLGQGPIGSQIYPGVGGLPPGSGSTGPQVFPGVGARPQGNGPVGPQVFPGVGGSGQQIPQRPPPGVGPLFQANPNFNGGPDGGGYGAGYPFGYPGGIGGSIYPNGGIFSGQRESNGYGFYPSQYYPNIPYGGGPGGYNNDIAGDLNNNYAPGYNFGIEGKSKKIDNIKATPQTNEKNVVKKSVNNKLLKI